VNPRIGCNALKDIPAETADALKEYNRQTGGKRKRKRKTKKRRLVKGKRRNKVTKSKRN